jgi:hypothetical protein
MSLAINDIHDFIRILREHPEWREEVLRHLLTKDLLELPTVVRELAAAQRQTEQQIAALAAAQRQTEQRLAALAERTDQWFAALSEQIAALAAAQQRTEERLAALSEATERRFAELAAAQQRTEEQIAALTAAQRQTEQQIAALVAAQQQMERRLHQFANEAAAFRGYLLEERYRTRADAYFGKLLRRLALFRPRDIEDRLEPVLDPDEFADWLETDLLVRGIPRRRPELGEVWLVLEVSGVVDRHDVERAVARARLLRRAFPRALPAVAGERLAPEAESAAAQHHVVVLRDGIVLRWDEALDAWAG